MRDPIEEFYETVDEEMGVHPDWLKDMLFEYNLMIVPIEDPTNLFGIREDSL